LSGTADAGAAFARLVAGRPALGEVDILRRIVRVRAPERFSNDAELAMSLRGLRDLDDNVFTYRRLAEMFSVSVEHVSNLLKRSE